MTVRVRITSAALGLSLSLGLLMSLSVAAYAACEGDACRAPGKPLNIMQFMREQAASTRVGERTAKPRVAQPRVAKPQLSQPRPTASAHRAPHRTIVARKKSAPMPVDAAASFASPEKAVQMPGMGGPFIPVDPAAVAAPAAAVAAPAEAPAESTGTAMLNGPEVQLVSAEEFNDIDRKADSGPSPANVPSPAIVAEPDVTPTHTEAANPSWLRKAWAALGNTFAALATAMHQLIRVVV